MIQNIKDFDELMDVKVIFPDQSEQTFPRGVTVSEASEAGRKKRLPPPSQPTSTVFPSI